jgi:hypothetical protein
MERMGDLDTNLQTDGIICLQRVIFKNHTFYKVKLEYSFVSDIPTKDNNISHFGSKKKIILPRLY